MNSNIRKHKWAVLFAGVLMLLSTSIAVTHVFAATTISFTGTIGVIEIDNGLSTYSGLSAGDSFSGSITYGDSSSDASGVDIISPNLVDYIFTGTLYGGSLTTGSIFTTVVNSSVGIWDNKTMDDDAAIINSLYGAGSTTAGTIADAWFAESAGSAQFFGVSLYSLDTLTFPGTDFQAAPPTLAGSDFAVFFVGEVDDLDNDIFLATGIITSISVKSTPSCDIQLNQAAYIDGDTVTADVFRVANLTGAPVAVEVKVWHGLPDSPPISFLNIGADGSFVLAAGADIDRGPFPLLSVTPDLPRGTHEVSCRMLDPVTGELLAEDLNPFEIQTENTYAIGDTGPAGGIVFHVTDGGLHGLEAAPVDQQPPFPMPGVPWGCHGLTISGADGTAIGTGAQNTVDILSACSDLGIAARLADSYTLNGFTDWYLPSKDELNELYLQRALVGNFTSNGNGYWSSTEMFDVGAWFQDFDDGSMHILDRNGTTGVRAIRSF